MGAMLVLLAVVIAPKWPVPDASDHWRLVDRVYACAFFFKFAVMAFLLYAIARLSRVVSRLRRGQPKMA